MPEKAVFLIWFQPVMIRSRQARTPLALARIGRAARKVLGAQPESVEITFYNSFARTYEATEATAPLLLAFDYATDDTRIKKLTGWGCPSRIEISF